MNSHFSKSSLNQNTGDLEYVKDSKYRTFVLPCDLLLYRSVNLSLLPGIYNTGILVLFYKHNRSAEFVVLCARSPLCHPPERNICNFVYKVSIQNDFQYFLLFFIPFILSSVWFFHQLSCLKPKVRSWQKAYSMTERAVGEIDLYKRGLLWSECFLFFLPCLWIWDEQMISSFTNEDLWLSIKRNNWCGGDGS